MNNFSEMSSHVLVQQYWGIRVIICETLNLIHTLSSGMESSESMLYLWINSWLQTGYYFFNHKIHNFVLWIFVCLVAHLCPTLCDPMDHSPPGSFVHGILQERILQWVAISLKQGFHFKILKQSRTFFKTIKVIGINAKAISQHYVVRCISM